MKNIISKENEKLSQKEIDILEKNKKFFSSNQNYVKTMLDIIDRKSDISIRVIDWFVANYSKKHDTYYKIKINNKYEYFYVNDQYKNNLRSYSKEYFDPFCRRKKIIYTHTMLDGTSINFESSIGQLNFFRWAIRNKIIKYVELHRIEIETDMKETAKANKESKLTSQEEMKLGKCAEEELIETREYADPVICSSDKINSLLISPLKSNTKSDSDNKNKRQKLSKSVYDYGIKKTNIPIKLDFD